MICERDPLGASPFGLDLIHPRFCRQSPRVAGVKPAWPAQPTRSALEMKMFTAVTGIPARQEAVRKVPEGRQEVARTSAPGYVLPRSFEVRNRLSDSL